MFLLCELRALQVTDGYRRHLMQVRGGQAGGGLRTAQIEVAPDHPFVTTSPASLTVLYVPNGAAATALVKFTQDDPAVSVALTGNLLVLPCVTYGLEVRSTTAQQIQLTQMESQQ